MENIRKFYLPIIHFVSLGLLAFLLTSSPWMTVKTKFYKEGQWEQKDWKESWKEGDIVNAPSKYEIGKIHDYPAFSTDTWNRSFSGQGVESTKNFVYWELTHYELRNSAERQNRALIVYTLLAMYLGSGYLLFKKN